MSMDKRLVTWFWFDENEITRSELHGHNFNKLLAQRLRKAADDLETTQLHISAGGNVSLPMGTPFGYFESQDEAKKYTR